jgi:NAD(P)-dependent dehydrogenase (short-subunit alcohol dehydrogenase family)
MKWAFVTGAGQRLGRGVALTLAKQGWGVAVHYRNSRAEAEAVVAEIRAAGGEAVALQADLADASVLPDLMAAAQTAARDQLVGLVNCASMFEHDALASLSAKTLHQHMDVNALAPSLLAREFALVLPEGARGAVVNFLDFKLASPYPDHFSYTLSKYALSGATDLLARALAPRVRVNAVAPGFVLPAPGQTEADYLRLHADTPLGYGPTPDDIAGAVLFLLENPAVTGQTIYVDAGRRFRAHDRDMAFM